MIFKTAVVTPIFMEQPSLIFELDGVNNGESITLIGDCVWIQTHRQTTCTYKQRVPYLFLSINTLGIN